MKNKIIQEDDIGKTKFFIESSIKSANPNSQENDLKKFRDHIIHGRSFLSSQLKFQRIRNILMTREFYLIKDSINSKKVKDFLWSGQKENGWTIDFIYISNIGRRIFRQYGNLSKYTHAIQNLSLNNQKTWILDSWLGSDRKLFQRVYKVHETEDYHSITAEDKNIRKKQPPLPFAQ